MAAEIQYETQVINVAMGSLMSHHKFLPGVRARVSQMSAGASDGSREDIRLGLIYEDVSFKGSRHIPCSGRKIVTLPLHLQGKQNFFMVLFYQIGPLLFLLHFLLCS